MKRIYPILAKCVDALENLYDIMADHRCKDLFGADIMPRRRRLHRHGFERFQIRNIAKGILVMCPDNRVLIKFIVLYNM